MKDIFIDTNIACQFTNPVEPEHIKLISWLQEFHGENHEDNAYLVWSVKLQGEYNRSTQAAQTKTCIHIIIDQLTREGRLNPISNKEIKEFKRKYYSKPRLRKMKCNAEDREHIPAILLSKRKFAVANDENFVNDINNFPGFNATAVKDPKDLNYK